MRARPLLLLSSVCIVGGASSGCEKEKAESKADANGGLSKLDATQERRVGAVDTSRPLLNPSLADALVGLPRDHGPRVVGLAYPEATIRKKNPRVNTLFRVRGAGALDTLDIRWSRVRKRLIGSVVFTYRRGVDVAALGALVQGVAKPVEGEKERWLVEGGRLAITFIPQNMDGETVVAFELATLEGAPIGGEDDMKQAEEWGLKGEQREKRLKAGRRRSDSEASGGGRASDDADDAVEGADAPVGEDATPAAKKPAVKKPAAEPDEDLFKALDDL